MNLYKNCLFSFFTIVISVSAMAQTPDDIYRNKLISQLVESSKYLDSIKPIEAKEEEKDNKNFYDRINKKVQSSLNEVKLKSKQLLPEAYWIKYKESLRQYIADFNINIPKRIYKKIISLYVMQLSYATTKQLENLVKKDNFENTKLFNTIVDTGKLSIASHKEKLVELLKTVDRHRFKIKELNIKFNVLKKPESGLSAAEELKIVRQLAIKAIAALNKNDSESWSQIICRAQSSDAALIGWNSAKSLIKKVSSYNVIKQTPKSNSDINISEVVFEITNNKYDPEDFFYKKRLKFYFNKDHYTEKNPCVGLTY